MTDGIGGELDDFACLPSMAVMESDAVRTKTNATLLSCLTDWAAHQEQVADRSSDWAQVGPHTMRANLARQLAHKVELRGSLYSLGWLGGRLAVTFGIENDGWTELAKLVRAQAWPAPGEPAFGDDRAVGDPDGSAGA